MSQPLMDLSGYRPPTDLLPTYRKVDEPQINKEISRLRGSEYRWKAAEVIGFIGKIAALAAFIFVVAYGSHFGLSNSHIALLALGSVATGALFNYFEKKAREKSLHYKNLADNKFIWITGKAPEEFNCPLIKKIGLYVDATLFHAYKGISSVIRSTPSNLIAPSHNTGKWDDISVAAEMIKDQGMTQRALNHHGIVTSPNLSLEPFGKGVCAGACLHFAKEYLKTKNIEATALLFSNGAPLQAVILHAKQQLLNGDPLPHPSNPTKNTEEGFTFRKRQAFFNEAELDTDKPDTINFEQLKESLDKRDNGVYYVKVPFFDTSHAVLVIKEGDSLYLFDPNRGTQKEISSELTKQLGDRYAVSPSDKIVIYPVYERDLGEATLAQLPPENH